MRREWKLYLAFIGTMAAVPFLHEYIHAFTSITFGYPTWIVWTEWVSKYSYDGALPPLWIRLVVRHSPELVMLSFAAILTWKFRNDWGLILVIPFLLISILGLLGHAGYLG